MKSMIALIAIVVVQPLMWGTVQILNGADQESAIITAIASFVSIIIGILFVVTEIGPRR